MKKLYFVRHGQTEWNAIARMQGQWNSDLNNLGRRQADVNGQLLASLGIDAMFASPLDRTQQTARIVNEYLDLPIEYERRIMEWDCGDWSGHLYADVKRQWAREWAALEADRFNYRGPNCENYPDMIERSAPFLDELKKHEARNIAIVSHGMIGRVMVSTLLGFDPQTTLSFHQPNDVIFVVTLDSDAVDLHHYSAGKGPYEGLFGDV